jgi:uracil-DNA glycosylase
MGIQKKGKACADCPYNHSGSQGQVNRDPIHPTTRLVVCGPAPSRQDAYGRNGYTGPDGRLLRGRLSRCQIPAWENHQEWAADFVALCRPTSDQLFKLGGDYHEIDAECSKRHPRAKHEKPVLLLGRETVTARTGYSLPIESARGSVLPLRDGGWAVASVEPSYCMHGKGDKFKGQANFLPLLGNDIRRALTASEPDVRGQRRRAAHCWRVVGRADHLRHGVG